MNLAKKKLLSGSVKIFIYAVCDKVTAVERL